MTLFTRGPLGDVPTTEAAREGPAPGQGGCCVQLAPPGTQDKAADGWRLLLPAHWIGRPGGWGLLVYLDENGRRGEGFRSQSPAHSLP